MGTGRDMVQGYGTRVWDKSMGQGMRQGIGKGRVWDYGIRVWDKGMGQGKGMGLWDKGMV